VKGEHWPDGWRGIPPSGNGDDTAGPAFSLGR
jgi:hypothetical protein